MRGGGAGGARVPGVLEGPAPGLSLSSHLHAEPPVHAQDRDSPLQPFAHRPIGPSPAGFAVVCFPRRLAGSQARGEGLRRTCRGESGHADWEPVPAASGPSSLQRHTAPWDEDTAKHLFIHSTNISEYLPWRGSSSWGFRSKMHSICVPA